MVDALRVHDLLGCYRGSFGTVHAVNNVSLTVRRGEIVGLAGESGCGKSTFLRLLTGLINPPLHYEGGEVIMLTKDTEEYNIWNMNPNELKEKVSGKLISYVPQSSFDALYPSKRIRNFIADMLEEHEGRKHSSDEIHKMLADHFSRLGLDEAILDRYPHELSGGMRQRTVVAISTYLRPYILLLDEPTSALDVSSQKLLIELLAQLQNEKIVETMIFSSHDIAVLRQICHRIAIMYAGKIAEMGDMEDIINNSLHPYTQGLINALLPLEHDVRSKSLIGIGGRPPDLSSPPPGCRFHPRCSQCTDICEPNEPPLVEVAEGHFVSCWLYSKES
jgi:peptide/nickel transport system ATP-binding protein